MDARRYENERRALSPVRRDRLSQQDARAKFLAVYPQFADKTLAVPNPVFRGEIRERAKAPLPVPVDERSAISSPSGGSSAKAR